MSGKAMLWTALIAVGVLWAVNSNTLGLRDMIFQKGTPLNP